MINFVVPGEPMAKGRPRMAVVDGHARTYTDAKTDKYENLVTMIAREHAPKTPIEGPLAVHIMAVFGRPKRLLARSKRTGKLLHATEDAMLHAQRPDLDNAIKAVLDGVNRAGIWRDDAQVSTIVAHKRFCSAGGAPGVYVSIMRFDDAGLLDRP